mmetsp:Transcript_26859/g.48818  ORF Transcript_26859/g.48818 Transcript_26859/m.48818 type:complete len:876 (-) Transcript_26859:104-2731(-)
MTGIDDDTREMTMDSIEKELNEAEQRLSQKQADLEAIHKQAKSHPEVEGQSIPPPSASIPGVLNDQHMRLGRLQQLNSAVGSLSFASDLYAVLREHAPTNKTLVSEVRRALALGYLLQSHSDVLSNDMFDTAIQEYIEWHSYVRSRLQSTLASMIRSSGYPSEKGCQVLQDEVEVYLEKIQDVDDNVNSDTDVIGNQSFDGADTISSCIAGLHELQLVHNSLLQTRLESRLQVSSGKHTRMDAVDVLCKPVADRVLYHFLRHDEGNSKGESSSSLSSSRTDRLPEWLFRYMRDMITAGPYELIASQIHVLLERVQRRVEAKISAAMGTEGHEQHDQTTKDTRTYFLGEMEQLAQHVLHKRNFFRHPSVVGPSSSPMLLCSGIEQVLLFDAFLQSLIPVNDAVLSSDPDFDTSFPTLLGAFVTSDAKLMAWWTEMEREYATTTLFDTPEEAGTISDKSALSTDDYSVQVFSRKAELFVALLESLRWKACAITDPQSQKKFVANAIVPLCMDYTDAIHTSATDLRGLLCRQRQIPSDDDICKNVQSWMEVITGTHLAATVLISPQFMIGQSNDLGRLGRSLERLRDGIVDEFGSALVETILMERAKMASYLMRCPYILSMDENEVETEEAKENLMGDTRDMDLFSGEGGLSSDLSEAVHVIAIVLRVCSGSLDLVASMIGDPMVTEGNIIQQNNVNSNMVWKNSDGGGPGINRGTIMNIAQFGPRAVIENIAGRIQTKFLEVALDEHGMSPDIAMVGSKVFRRDVSHVADLFSVNPSAPRFFSRLQDIVNLMAMDKLQFNSLRGALHTLVQSISSRRGMYENDSGLDDGGENNMVMVYEDFASDGTVLDEAQSMLQAKGFFMIQLEDVVSVMNRRKY